MFGSIVGLRQANIDRQENLIDRILGTAVVGFFLGYCSGNPQTLLNAEGQRCAKGSVPTATFGLSWGRSK